jgi:integrase
MKGANKNMGVDLKGKDLGPNLSQRKKDGKYRARFITASGKRVDRIFDNVKDAKQWLANAKYEDANSILILNNKTSVDCWYKQWIGFKENNKRPNTVRNYRNRYELNIKPVIGRMMIGNVRAMDCQKILDNMANDDYATSTIKQTFITMQSMFYAAYENDVIRKTPITKSGVIVPEGEAKKEIDFFSYDEQKFFLQVAKDYAYYEQFALILLTGLRISEVIGLTWDCVDLENKTLRVEKTLEYRYSRKNEKSLDGKIRKDGWEWGPPKTKKSNRTISLTDSAVQILARLKDKPYLKESNPKEFRNLVFLSKKDGLPIKNNTYDNALRKRIDIMTNEWNDEKRAKGEALIHPHYLSCHDLRHTFATRFLESASGEYAKSYKMLSQMMGHSSIKITLDLYSHLTEETVKTEIDKFSNYMDRMVFA